MGSANHQSDGAERTGKLHCGPRWLLVGKIDQKHWSAVITRRAENIRLISVRRSRDEEVAIYESQDI
jgi:uncharacterized protein